jgi:hypothetical protein
MPLVCALLVENRLLYPNLVTGKTKEIILKVHFTNIIITVQDEENVTWTTWVDVRKNIMQTFISENWKLRRFNAVEYIELEITSILETRRTSPTSFGQIFLRNEQDWTNFTKIFKENDDVVIHSKIIISDFKYLAEEMGGDILIASRLCIYVYKPASEPYDTGVLVRDNLGRKIGIRSDEFLEASESLRYLTHVDEDQSLFLSFRGTTNQQNWVTNATILSSSEINKTVGVGSVHGGFLQMANHVNVSKLVDIVQRSIRRPDNDLPIYKKLIICGHSLGGALLHWLLQELFSVCVKTVTQWMIFANI